MARDRITPGRWATMRRPRATEERTKVGGIKITLAVAWGMDPWEPKNKMETSVRKLVYGHKKTEMRVRVDGKRMILIMIVLIIVITIRVPAARTH